MEPSRERHRTGPLLREVRAMRSRLEEIESLTQRAERTVGDVPEGSAPAGADEALRAMVRHLAQALDLYFTSLTERLRSDPLPRTAPVRQLLPVCAWCRRMRNAAGHWLEVEAWINQQCGAAFTHGICPDCRVQVVAER